MKDITLYGAGGHCFAMVDLIRNSKDYDPVVILDDAPSESTILDVPVQSSSSHSIATKAVVISIGNNEIRKKLTNRYSDRIFPSFIHSSVHAYASVTIGAGSQVLPGAVLDAAVTIGSHCIINLNATLSHNVIIHDFCHIAINAALAGGVVVGEGSLIGAGSIILPEVSIGKWAIIGAGAVVTKDVPDYAVVYGNPAKIIRYNQSNEN